MASRVVTSDAGFKNVTIVPQEDAMVVPQFSKARFGSPSYDASQVDAWVSEALSKNAKLRSDVGQLRFQLNTLSAQVATIRRSTEDLVARKDSEISHKSDEIASLNDKLGSLNDVITDLKASLAQEKSRNSLSGVADELDALRNKTQSLCDKRLAEATSKAKGIQDDADKYAQDKRSAADKYSADTKSKADEYSNNTRAEADNYAESVKAEADLKAQGIIDAATKRGAGMVEVTKKNIQALRNKSFGVLEKASKAGIDKLTVAEEARSSVAKLLADLSAQVASFSNNDGDVLKELKNNTVESLSAEFDSNVLDMTSDAQTVDDVIDNSKNTDKAEEKVEAKAEDEVGAKEETKAEAKLEDKAEDGVGAKPEEPTSTKKEPAVFKEPPAPPVQKVKVTHGIRVPKQGITLQKSGASKSASEETVVLPAVSDSTETEEELPEVTSEMSALGLEAVADME